MTRCKELVTAGKRKGERCSKQAVIGDVCLRHFFMIMEKEQDCIEEEQPEKDELKLICPYCDSIINVTKEKVLK